jgi:hypothetical protein
VTAIPPRVRVFHREQVEKLFPVRTLLRERRAPKTGLDPVRHAILGHARLLHVVEVLVARDRAAPKFSVFNGLEQRAHAAGFHTRFDQATHEGRYDSRDDRRRSAPRRCLAAHPKLHALSKSSQRGWRS